MKTLSCIISVAALAGLVLLAAASVLGLSFPFALVASQVVGFSSAAGVFAFFLRDYAPRGRRYDAVKVRKPAAHRQETFAPGRRGARSGAGEYYHSVAEGALLTLGLRNDPATLSRV